MAKDLTNVFKINADEGIIKYTVKAHGNYYTGRAKVNFDEGDEFDVNKGCRIAKLRALLKMKNGLIKENLACQEFIQKCIDAQKSLETEYEMLQDSTARIEAKLYAELNS